MLFPDWWKLRVGGVSSVEGLQSIRLPHFVPQRFEMNIFCLDCMYIRTFPTSFRFQIPVLVLKLHRCKVVILNWVHFGQQRNCIGKALLPWGYPIQFCPTGQLCLNINCIYVSFVLLLTSIIQIIFDSEIYDLFPKMQAILKALSDDSEKV